MSEALVVGELAVSSGASFAVATGVNAEPLLTALITFGVSLVTLAGGELIKFLVAFLKKKREQLESKKDEDYKAKAKEADEIVEVVEQHNKEE